MTLFLDQFSNGVTVGGLLFRAVHGRAATVGDVPASAKGGRLEELVILGSIYDTQD